MKNWRQWDVEDWCALIGCAAISLMGVLLMTTFMIYVLSAIR